MVSGKLKGGEYERVISKKLSLWITNGDRNDLFWRSAMSGGRATLALRRGEVAATQAGDISAIHPLGHLLIGLFAIECKHWADLELRQLVTNNGGATAGFWDKIQEEAEKNSKRPMLIMKQNHIPDLLVFDLLGTTKFKMFRNKTRLMCRIPRLGMYIYLLHEFLTNTDPLVLKGGSDEKRV